jgi:hypothetical protein
MNIYLIELCGQRYQCRIDSVTRTILDDGKWMNPEDFVDHLIAKKKWDQVCELATFGFSRAKLSAIECQCGNPSHHICGWNSDKCCDCGGTVPRW